MTRDTAIRIAGWIALLPLLFLTALSLIKHALWSAALSGDFGMAAQPALLTHASHMANLWLALLVTAEIVTVVVLFLLLPARLRVLLRFVVAVLAVPLLTGLVAWALIVVGHFR